MAAFERPLEDPLVECCLVEALLRINPDVKTEAQAKLAVCDAAQDDVTPGQTDGQPADARPAARRREGARSHPGEDATTVHFIAFDPAQQHLNDFTATNQYRVQGVKQCREDTVLLVNGIPLVIAEYKSYLASGKDWREAVHQLHRYQRQAPLMLTPNVFCVAADEDEFRYGTVLFHDASKDDIERHLDLWGRWLSLYPERHGWWNELDAARPGRSAGDSGQGPAATEAGACARLPPALRRLRDQEGEDGQEDRALSAVRGGERACGPDSVARRQAGGPPGPHGPHLAHAGLRQVADHDLRRSEAPAAPGARTTPRS